ncbi:uncharacterized protein LAJ45_08276 [Morchella importuna]|uniref:uncharacterized protein n=1 Tax=Morchella importuna TaxID=1174673 RepID=UPI001E8E6384|nr:uncharacterized protein LAJ45_08276 [Morchella importuna]KAH8147810.1 hypothetical protein LAJ45_08276 [Morchella importuna]
MAIIERAFSYGGILIRTFQHADSPPTVPQPASSGAPSPAWVSEQLPPPKRTRKKRQANPPQTPVQLDLSSLLTPDTTTSESGSLRDAGPNSLSALKDLPHYISLLTPVELRAIQTRNRRGKHWIPPESTVRKELVKLGRGINGETTPVHASRSKAADAPVRYMQETGRATDIDRFAVGGVLGAPSMQEESMLDNLDEHFVASDHGATDGRIEWLAPRSVLVKDSNNGNMISNGAGRGNEHVHPSPAHGVTLPSPISVSTKDDQQGLYLPPLSTHVTNSESTNNARSLVVKLSLPSTAQKSRVLPAEPVPTPAQASSMGPLQTQTTTPNFAGDSAPPAQGGRGRGRPRKSLHAIDITQEAQLIAAPQSLAPSLSPIAPQPPAAPSPILTNTPSQSSQKRKRTPLSSDLTDTSTPPTLHFYSVSDLLSHLTSTVASSSSGFIPRPVRVSYTLPKSALSAYIHEPGDKLYKAFGVDLVAQISAIDKFKWRIAHSQWGISNGKHTPGARWVCNLSEEGSRDRGSRGGAPSGAGLRPNGFGDPPASKTRYPCSGSISLRFSANKDIVSFKYSHHAVHAPPSEDDVQTKRVKLYQNSPSGTWGASAPPAQGFSNTYTGVDGGGGGICGESILAAVVI